ncbi:MAG: zinc finger CCCH domain-containing protein, partial [archaeon]|nr:zinc finger CCCH domain-containing protein [archaeon]
VPGTSMSMNPKMSKANKNMLNYKIVKCKNFERDGKCKYGDHCTFAHSDDELRVKCFTPVGYDIYNQMGMGMMPYGNMMDQQQMMSNAMMMGMDPNMMMMGQPQPQEGLNEQMMNQMNYGMGMNMNMGGDQMNNIGNTMGDNSTNANTNATSAAQK